MASSHTPAASSSGGGDPMDTTPTRMGPPADRSPKGEKSNGANQEASGEQNNSDGNNSGGNSQNGSSAPTGAAAAAQQPKVVQTAFIHKLYNMLEDRNIQHLISWSSSNESFLMSPSGDFAKVLASYFKHTNISSFVRQLNMYGFHKVSDVFQTGSPDSPMWEFKHGNGNFKRGDLVGLREIKRRASRHALIHRDSFSGGPKASTTQPGTPSEQMPDPVETRLNILEHSLYDMSSRLQRTEDHLVYANQRNQHLQENLTRSFQWHADLTNILLTLLPDPEAPVARDVAILKTEILRQTEGLRALEEPMGAASDPRFFGHFSPSAPVSPRQGPIDSRRGSLNPTRGNYPSSLRPPTANPSLSTLSPRRYGSFSNAPPSGAYSPSRAPPQPSGPSGPPPPPASLGALSALGRRHTSADIRTHGWQPHLQGQGGSGAQGGYASGASSSQWPSSPHRAPVPSAGGGSAADQEGQQIRNMFAGYEIRQRPSAQHSRPTSPPPPHISTGNADGGNPFAGSGAGGGGDWNLPGQRFPFRGHNALDTPGPPTRRSSMASNVHSLLNPAETREEEEGGEERKRKRLG